MAQVPKALAGVTLFRAEVPRQIQEVLVEAWVREAADSGTESGDSRRRIPDRADEVLYKPSAIVLLGSLRRVDPCQ